MGGHAPIQMLHDAKLLGTRNKAEKEEGSRLPLFPLFSLSPYQIHHSNAFKVHPKCTMNSANVSNALESVLNEYYS